MRTVLAVILLSFLSMMPASAGDHDANFLIKHAGKVIGFHNVDIIETDSGFLVETTIRMRVKFGPIPLFRYDHSAVEEWRDGVLYSLVSETNNDGEDCFVRVMQSAEGYEIEGSGYSGAAPLGAMPSSYWNKNLITADAIISTQTGEIIDIAVTDLGRTQTPNNRMAEQYRLVGTLALDIWYDGSKWVGSNFTVDGEELTYEMPPPAREYASLEEGAD